MIRKVLIANRGEIAVRIIRACHELGIEAVAVYSQADKDSLHVQLADQAICIGEASSQQSYLHIPSIIAAAEISGADAIHPGYGFLAENPDFAQICEDTGIIFIGPPAEAIALMGNKSAAKETMKKAGVPVVPGSEGSVASLREAKEVAESIGYPVMLKAAAGGGGKGMRLVNSPEELERAWITARNEAEAAFGNPEVYVEKFIRKPRHIEFQIFADTHGTTIHLNERECSIQRRHQKLIEEAPSPIMTPALRQQMGEAAVRAAQAVRYVNAGTVEFLVDEDRNFYFMEMNTRIQVEHPVTEQSLGVDLVKEQLQVADGKPLSIQPMEPIYHAIECRINAEDPYHYFRPSPGQITKLHLPGGPGIRIDSHIYQGYRIPPYYDSMIAKFISYGKDREEAMSRMYRALQEAVIEGVHTTIPFHLRMLENPDFIAGDFDTRYLDTHEWDKVAVVSTGEFAK